MSENPLVQYHPRKLFLSLPVSHHAEKNCKHDISPTICALLNSDLSRSQEKHKPTNPTAALQGKMRFTTNDHFIDLDLDICTKF